MPVLLAAPAAGLLAFFLIGPLLLLARLSLYEPADGRGFYRPGTWTLRNLAAFTESPGVDVLTFTLPGLKASRSTGIAVVGSASPHMKMSSAA